MSWLKNLFVQNTAGNKINPATEESLMILRQILKYTESLGYTDIFRRLKLVVDDYTGNTSGAIQAPGSGTQTTAMSISGTGGAVNATLGGNSVIGYLGAAGNPVFDLKWTTWDMMNTAYNNTIRSHLTFS